MAVLNILNYPDPRLHTVAKPVKEVDANIRRLINDMTETMYAAPGIGLAATQVNQHIQLLIIDTSETKDALQVFINPKKMCIRDRTRPLCATLAILITR